MAYQQEQRIYYNLIAFHKQQVLSGKIAECGRDSKKLFTLISNLTCDVKLNPLSLGDSDQLAEEFADFFYNKIVNIRTALEDEPLFQPFNNNIPKLSRFPPLMASEVESIINSMGLKSCETDAINTHLLKQMLPACLDIITDLVNTSMNQGIFCEHWKEVIVRPLLKKIGLALMLKNYRPVSNLPFLSKLLERCMLHHFTKHCEEFGLLPDFQSAYREGYSCETSLLGLCDGILSAMENQEVTAVTIMDLSAAFNTVDHDILLSILSNSFGIHDLNALS